MQETYKLRDLVKLARQNPSLLKETSYEDFRLLQDQYKKKFGFELETWLIGPETGVSEFILRYCLKTGIPVGDDKCPPGSLF